MDVSSMGYSAVRRYRQIFRGSLKPRRTLGSSLIISAFRVNVVTEMATLAPGRVDVTYRSGLMCIRKESFAGRTFELLSDMNTH